MIYPREMKHVNRANIYSKKSQIRRKRRSSEENDNSLRFLIRNIPLNDAIKEISLAKHSSCSS